MRCLGKRVEIVIVGPNVDRSIGCDSWGRVRVVDVCVLCGPENVRTVHRRTAVQEVDPTGDNHSSIPSYSRRGKIRGKIYDPQRSSTGVNSEE